MLTTELEYEVATQIANLTTELDMLESTLAVELVSRPSTCYLETKLRSLRLAASLLKCQTPADITELLR